jgi:hypothetical protein
MWRIALLLQLHELADLVLGRELVIDAVQLEQVDGVNAEPAQAHFTFLSQVGGEPEDRPLVGPGAQQAGLGRDDEPVRIGMQRLFDQLFRHIRAVGIRGVDEVHADLDEASQYPDALVAVIWRAPYALPRQAHRAETQTIDGQIAADGEGGHVRPPYADIVGPGDVWAEAR